MPADRHAGALLLVLLLAGCSSPIPLNRPPSSPVGDHTAAPPESRDLLDFLVDSALWPAERRAAELRRLRAGPPSGVRAEKIAWLEAGKGNRPRELLARLKRQEPSGDRRRLLHLLQHLLQLEQELRQERDRGARLHDRIERLKALERDLSQREAGEGTP